MRPDLSVLLLTTLIGAGQGLFVALFSTELATAAGLVAAQDGHRYYAHGSLLALAFLLGGLIASFFHLGRPERAWRAAAKWRTSWLSREVIVLPALMATVFLYGVCHLLRSVGSGFAPGDGIAVTMLLGFLGALLAFALFVCTAMIYACLPFLREWASPLTVVNYTLQGLASGFTLAAAFASAAAPDLVSRLAGVAFVLTALGLASRIASLARNAHLVPGSTLQTALGIREPRITQKSMGFMGGSFNTREFFHGTSASTLRRMQGTFIVAAFLAPLALLGACWAGASPPFARLAFVIQFVGLVAERWCFFAEARHSQNLYYQAVA
jgi:DMSO reductase anchor subunit